MRERVQVQGPQGAQQLQTTARPGATAVAPQRQARSTSLQLAEALSSIEPELRAHLGEMQQEYEVKEAERAYDTLQGMTFQEAKALVDGGKIRETENPWYEAAFQKQFGIAYAGQRKRDIMQAYETQFDKHNGDIEGFIAGHVKRDASLYGENKFVSAGIREGMGDFLTRVRDQHATFKSGLIKEETSNQFYGAARTVVDEAVVTGDDPSAAVRTLYEQHRTTFGLTYQQMDDHVLQLAQEYADNGDVDTVRALLETEITGADGQKVGSFVNRPRYSADAQTLINKAEAKKGEIGRQATTNEVVGFRVRAADGRLSDGDKFTIEAMRDAQMISQEMAESMLTQNENAKQGFLAASQNALQETGYRTQVSNMLISGQAFAIQDHTYVDANGKSHTLKRDEILDGVVNETLTQMAVDGMSENQMAATLSSWGVGSKFQVWENTLSDGYLALSSAIKAVGPDGDITLPPAAEAAYQTWKNLSQFPNVRAHHVTDAAALNVYRDAEALERGGMDWQTALLTSANIDRDAARNGLSGQINRDTLERAVRGAVNGGVFGGAASNAGYISSTIETTARILMDGNLGADKAVKEAKRMFEESHTVINGAAVNTRNKLIPQDFPDMADNMIDAFALQHDEDPDDLTLVPSIGGEQHWIIARKSTLMPHEFWTQGGSYTINDIQNSYQKTKEAERAMNVQELNSELERRSYSYKEWQGMSRKDRREKGLPVSVIGGEWWFKDRK